MIISRKELSELLEVQERYLCPSNFQHAQGGAKEKGYNLISMSGRGAKAIYFIEKIEEDLEGEIWKSFPLSPNY